VTGRTRFRQTRRIISWVLATSLLVVLMTGTALGHPDHDDNSPGKGVPAPDSIADVHFAMVRALELEEMRSDLEIVGSKDCTNGTAGAYQCDGVDLISFLPLWSLGGGDGNDIWGWTDPETHRDYAIMGRTTGISFVDITNPTRPKLIGMLPGHSFSSIWRDLKVYDSHVFVVSEAGGSGLQVFDLRRLRDRDAIPHTFDETAYLGSFSTAHNIAINEASGFAYVVGSNTCSGGLHMVDVRNPASPQSAGCFLADGYTHDVQCINYAGPDAQYQGREICLASNEDTLTIVDVTDKSSPIQVSRTTYADVGYAHQGWLTEDHRYFLTDDELDELAGASKTQTLVWDVSDLADPKLDFVGQGATRAIDHNQYVRGDFTYQTNYTAGLRILRTDELDAAKLPEVAYFDTHPETNSAAFDGAWSSYPYYRSNVVAVSTIDRGLFILGYAGTGGAVHVADLDNRAVVIDDTRWRARGKVKVRDAAGQPVAGATVTMRWSNGKVKSCVTAANGRCKTAITRSNARARASFRVLDIDLAGSEYASWKNEDPDGNSNGFRDTVRRPR